MATLETTVVDPYMAMLQRFIAADKDAAKVCIERAVKCTDEVARRDLLGLATLKLEHVKALNRKVQFLIGRYRAQQQDKEREALTQAQQKAFDDWLEWFTSYWHASCDEVAITDQAISFWQMPTPRSVDGMPATPPIDGNNEQGGGERAQ